MSNFNVTSFLQNLENNKPKPKDMTQKERSIEKLYLSYPGNYGKYQIFPMVSTITGEPFCVLKQTREVKVPRKNTLPDGTENVFEAWIKILPMDAYRMLDSNGRLVSSLTTEDENLLIQAQTTFDALYDALGGNIKKEYQKDGEKAPSVDPNAPQNRTTGLLRKRDYTVFHGKCLNKWTLSDARTPERTNFPALFVTTAGSFYSAIDENIQDGKISHNGEVSWLEQIYNRQLSNRSGYLIFSIAMNVGGKIGYQITATHESDRGNYLTQFGITEEESELMKDPIETFLGWQAGREPGRLFNKALMLETIAVLSEQLAAVRMAISTGSDVVKAMEYTSEQALKQMPNAPHTNDPMLAAHQGQQQGAISNPEAVVMNNNNPYSTPPAAQIDPISQNPVAPGHSAPFVQPGFATQQGPGSNPFGGGGYQQGNGNNPFQQ